MTLKRLFEESLAHASYLVGADGEAVVIDPNRDIDRYIEEAAGEGLRIVAVAETHIHADYASGAHELAARTGATLYVSDEGPADWKYASKNDPGIAAVRDGDQFKIGGLVFDVMSTPGHTPEHITFVLTDPVASDVPMAAFTGDFLFVGDVGRPDLLERAAGFAGTMEAGAKVLFGTIQRFLAAFDDSLLICPAHGAGSACGKSLGNVSFSTLGIERRTNWALKVASEGDFVREVLSGQPEPPVYFKEMKRINKERPAFPFRALHRVTGEALVEALQEGAVVVDIRPAGEIATGSLKGALAIPLGRSFTNWAGWTLPYDRDVLLLSATPEDAKRAAEMLALIGLTRVTGFSGSDALRAYERRFGALEVTPQFSPADLNARKDEVAVVDVRSELEFAESHIPGASHGFVGTLPRANLGIRKDRPLVVHCAGGARATLAASILRNQGFSNVGVMPGGFPDWVATGHPTESGQPALV